MSSSTFGYPLPAGLSIMNETAHPHHHHEDAHPTDYDASKVLIAKGVTMVVLCTVSTCMGILPMFLAKMFNWTTAGQVNPRYIYIYIFAISFLRRNSRNDRVRIAIKKRIAHALISRELKY